MTSLIINLPHLQSRRQRRGAQVVGYIDLHGQAITHADLEDFQIGQRTFQFGAELRHRIIGIRQ